MTGPALPRSDAGLPVGVVPAGSVVFTLPVAW